MTTLPFTEDPSPSSTRAESLCLEGIALTELEVGATGRLLADDLEVADRRLLEALGCPQKGRFTLCKAGSPWILRVHGTRIGISDEVAKRLRVLEETE